MSSVLAPLARHRLEQAAREDRSAEVADAFGIDAVMVVERLAGRGPRSTSSPSESERRTSARCLRGMDLQYGLVAGGQVAQEAGIDPFLPPPAVGKPAAAKGDRGAVLPLRPATRRRRPAPRPPCRCRRRSRRRLRSRSRPGPSRTGRADPGERKQAREPPGRDPRRRDSVRSGRCPARPPWSRPGDGRAPPRDDRRRSRRSAGTRPDRPDRPAGR